MKNKLTIVKVGGFIFEDEYKIDSFLSNYSKISGNKILVHGGGKIASNFSKKLGIVPLVLKGRRVTDKETLDVVVMTYAGLLNKKLVSKLQKLSCNAIGLSGADANLIQAKKRNIENVNYGYVGDITHVEKNILQKMISSDLCPVICSLTHDGNGQILNTNADTIAAELSIALADLYDVSLKYCSEMPGVLEKLGNYDSLIKIIDSISYKKLKQKNIISDGMIPKLENCFNALKNGVDKVFVGSIGILNSEEKSTQLKI